MNDADFEATKARVMAAFERWHGPLGLRWWRINLDWSREPAGGDEPASSQRTKMTAARTFVRWPYLEATIEFFLPALQDEDDERIEYIVVHELMHIMVNEMRWTDDNGDNIEHEERVCTTLAQGFMWARDSAQRGEAPAIAEVQ